MSLIYKTVAPGTIEANSYIIKDTASGEAAVVDAGALTKRLQGELSRMGIEKLKYILFTHGHFDHIMGAARLKKSYGGEIVIHKQDEPCLSDSSRNLAGLWGFLCPEAECDRAVTDGEELLLGEHRLQVIHTPGHSPGSVCYKAEGLLFSGDTLFRLGRGRTDFPLSSTQAIMTSLGRLAALEGDYVVCPGHGAQTTLSFERDNNPDMKGL